jgi:hypothetical protein
VEPTVLFPQWGTLPRAPMECPCTPVGRHLGSPVKQPQLISARGLGGRHIRRSKSSTMRVAAVGHPLVKPKNGPKSRVEAKPVM